MSKFEVTTIVLMIGLNAVFAAYAIALASVVRGVGRWEGRRDSIILFGFDRQVRPRRPVRLPGPYGFPAQSLRCLL